MKKLLSLLAVASLALSFTAHAADGDAKKAPTAQQSKMKTCNTEAGDKKGDERKAFMKTCLSANKETQQDKMKSCNTDAKTKDLKGDERKAFMKTCLSNKPATQQDKMKTCNADAKAKTLKGDERKAFMSECLKK